MSGALYYPSWTLRDPISYAEFLMYWDRLTFMTPSKDWKFDVYHDDNEVEQMLREAHEEYALAHVPTDKEKKRCHELLKKLMESRKIKLRKYVEVIDEKSYQIHADKLDYATVRMLEHQNVMKKYFGKQYKVSDASGRIVMAVLAHCCSSKGLPAVTRDDNQYKLHMLSLADSVEVVKNNAKVENIITKEDAFTILINRIKIPGLSSNDPRLLKKVLIARKKDDVNGYRKAFQEKVGFYCSKLEQSGSIAETRDILCDFDSELENDRMALIKELKLAGVDAAISKDGAIALVAGVILSIASLGLGATLAAAIELRAYQKARKEVLGNNWTSWLYNVQHPKFSIL
jgi:hypothetical protein